MYVEIFYGCIKVYDSPDEETQDVLVDLEDTHSKIGCAVIVGPTTWTLRFGIPVTTVTSYGSNLFPMREVLSVIDTKKMVLRADLEERWQTIMREIPYNLREQLSAPEFHIAWGS